MYFER